MRLVTLAGRGPERTQPMRGRRGFRIFHHGLAPTRAHPRCRCCGEHVLREKPLATRPPDVGNPDREGQRPIRHQWDLPGDMRSAVRPTSNTYREPRRPTVQSLFPKNYSGWHDRAQVGVFDRSDHSLARQKTFSSNRSVGRPLVRIAATMLVHLQPMIKASHRH
jgi:hypothetical protein